MQERIDFIKTVPDAYKAMSSLEVYVRQSGLEASLLELVKTRVSQINGCAFCLDMHTKDARAHGETEQRLYTLCAWRETPFFTERERAALAWAEALTLVSQEEISDDLYQTALRNFTESELVNLSMAIVAINGWNRLSIAFRKTPGTYQPAAR